MDTTGIIQLTPQQLDERIAAAISAHRQTLPDPEEVDEAIAGLIGVTLIGTTLKRHAKELAELLRQHREDVSPESLRAMNTLGRALVDALASLDAHDKRQAARFEILDKLTQVKE